MRARTLNQSASLVGIRQVSGRWSAGGDPGSLRGESRLAGVVRDSRERSDPGGHEEFEWLPRGGIGLNQGLCESGPGSQARVQEHRTKSNFRIETTLQLTKVNLPIITASYDRMSLTHRDTRTRSMCMRVMDRPGFLVSVGRSR